MVEMVRVGAIITRRSVCFPSLYGAPITHSVVFFYFSATVIVKFAILWKYGDTIEAGDNLTESRS